MPPIYTIGIDLGTTNCVVSYAELDAETPVLQLLQIPQLIASGTLENRTSLPSFLYLGTAVDAGFELPWAKQRDFVVGEFARRQAADVPDRTIGGAKSWLGHTAVDRHQNILPWNAPEEVPKISPVLATQRYLEHLIAAWTHQFPEAAFAEQQIVLTVPASFDASARELTREAAIAAGLPNEFVLLEEPQAAVYAWLAQTGDLWRKLLQVGDNLLVVDVGGGTTDLTLVSATETAGDLQLQRIAVGNHLLVGGDNMDLSLAHFVSTLFEEQGTSLDPWQSVSLWHSCRAAKETLMAEAGPKKQKISVLGRGRKLVGNTISVELDREKTKELLLDGFLPHCEISASVQKRRSSGFQQIGLPFETETAITKHVIDFLRRHSSDDQPIQPKEILVNGGVFKSPALSARLVEVLTSWFPDNPPRQLEGERDLDHAVARGAAYYGWCKITGGIRIRGGTARSYYVGIETSGLAIPGAPRPLNALCVVPHGMEEGTETAVPSSDIGLVVGEPAHFRFFSSATRKEDQPGQLLARWSEEELTETDSMEATLSADGEEIGNYVPVTFESKITELGMFELWCVNNSTDKRWKLEFSVRDDD